MRWRGLFLVLLLVPGRVAYAGALPPADTTTVRLVPWVNVNSDLGLLFGGAVRWVARSPGDTAARHLMQFRAGFATTPQSGAVEFLGRWSPRRHGPVTLVLEAKHSAIEVLNFFGFGTATLRDPDRKDIYYKAGQTHTVLAVGPALRLGVGTSLVVAGVLKQVHTEPDTSRFIATRAFYGVQRHFDQAGLRAALVHDGRDHPLLPRRGLRAEVAGSWYPAGFDVPSGFGALSATLAGAVSTSGRRGVTVAGRVSGMRTLGTYPLHEAAMLGGATTLRSHKNGRFAGDASLLASVDARVQIGHVRVRGEPWDAGVYALSDAGRVFVRAEDSRRWHYSVGGGVWLTPPDRRLVGRAELAAGDDGLGFRFGTAFRF